MQLGYDKLIKVAYPGEPSIFTDHQLEIINELIKYADYYDGNSFKYIEDKFPEYKTAKDYKPTKLTINLARYIVNKLAAWQFEIPVDYNCTSEAENRSDEIETDIYTLHKLNVLDLKYLQAATESNIAGGVVFKLKYDIENKLVKVMPRNRIECFPIYDFDDYEKITKVHFIAFMDEDTIWKQTYELVNTGVKNVCYIEEATYSVKNNLQLIKQILDYQPLGLNGTWLDFMPVYIIPNLPQIGEVFGVSELKDLIPLFEEIDKKYSDLSDSLKFEMFAITVLLNAKTPVDENGKPSLSGKAGAVWKLAGMSLTDGVRPEVFKLQSTFAYIDTLKYHIDSLMSLIYELAEMVVLSVDKIEGLSNLSGVALKLLFAAILSKTRKKNVIWSAKLREMWLGILKMKSIYEGYDVPEDLDIEIIFHNPLPQNELEAIEIATQKLAAGLSSVETEMNALGIEDPEEEIKKIIAEKMKFDKALNLDTRNEKPIEDNQDGN